MTALSHAMPERHAVRRSDRLWDAAAVILVLAGVALFFVARQALGDLGAGTYQVPKGVSAVARTDLHVTQTRLALWLVAVGMVLGAVAALRHHISRPR
jgi:uncharacterized membrane protein YidH (DUF202 family)